MRVVILNWRDLSHPEAGGAELYCHQVARELAHRGETVTMVTSRPSGLPTRDHIDGYTIVRRGGRFTVYLAALWWLLINRYQIDGVIDSQNGIPFFSPLVLRRRTPIVLLMHHVHQEQFALYFPPPIAALGRWLESAVARQVYGKRIIAAVSPSTRSAVRKRLRLRGSIRLALCGLAPLHRLERRRTPGPTIVAVGRLVPHKRLHLLIESLSEVRLQIPLVELHIVGEGTDRRRLEDHVARYQLGDCVVFHGKVSDDRRDELLSSAWLTVNPTCGEGWGLSVLEANRLGVPALAFRVDGLRDSIVDGVTGWLIDGNDSLGSAIGAALGALQDPQFEHQMEGATRAWSAAFTWQNTTRSLFNLLLEEHSRLSRVVDNRMHGGDLMTIVDIPIGAVPEGWSPTLRAGDIVQNDVDGFRLLLSSADHQAVPPLLRRIGVSGSSIDSGEVYVSVAGQQEVLLLTAGIRNSHPAYLGGDI